MSQIMKADAIQDGMTAEREVGGWQPIETAPKDGTWFLAYRPESTFGRWNRVVVVRWSDECGDFIWPDEIYDIYSGEPLDQADEETGFLPGVYEAGGSFTHWTPLPAPPAQQVRS